MRSIKANVSFDINIINDANEHYICNVGFEIPFENDNSSIYEDGYITKEINNLDKYNRLIEDAFKFKRKTLKNNLKNYDYEQINTILESHGFYMQNRAEQIPIDIFIEISNQI